MARRTIIVDDLDGGAASESIDFAVDGVSYRIDLSDTNATELRAAFARYTAVATKLGRTASPAVVGAPSKAPAGRTATDKEQNKAIREWAKRAGKEVAERGRIPQEIVDEFHACGGRLPAEKDAKKPAGSRALDPLTFQAPLLPPAKKAAPVKKVPVARKAPVKKTAVKV